MFDELRQQIREWTNAGKSRMSSRVSRTFFLNVTSSPSAIETWMRTSFPLPDIRLAALRPWISAREDVAELRGRLERAVAGAFDLQRTRRLLEAGYDVIDSASQAVVVGDLSIEDTTARVSETVQALDDALAKLELKDRVYKIGVFLLRRAAAQNGDAGSGDPTLTIRPTQADVRAEVATGLFPRLFHRVYLLDVMNPSGGLLTEGDQIVLIGQLLYYLASLPALAKSPAEYVEWVVGGRAEQARVCSFSGCSVLLPIDEILESVAVAKAAEIVQYSLLTEPEKSVPQFFVRHFTNTHALVTFEALTRHLSEDPEAAFANPTAAIPSLDIDNSGDYLQIVDAIDASLARVASEQGAVLDAVGEKRLQHWRESLDDHLESMVVHQRGGLNAAVTFLEQLHEHLASILRQPKGQATCPDTGAPMGALRAALAATPRDPALVARTLLLAGVTDLGAVSVATGIVETAGSVVAGTVAAVLLGGFVRHSSHHRVTKCVVQLEHAVREKWDVLIEHQRAGVAANIIAKLLALLQQAQMEMRDAARRISELVAYARDEHVPPLPEEFALWSYVERDPARFREYRSLCQVDVAKTARTYLQRDEPLRIWRRLERPGAPVRNAFENRLLEKAALRVLPDCGPIVALRILPLLQARKDVFRRYRRILGLVALPFLCLRPGAEEPERVGVLEAESREEEPIVDEILAAMADHFHKTTRLATPAAYRLSFFGLLEHAAGRDVLIKDN